MSILRGNGFPGAYRNDQRYSGGFMNPDICTHLDGTMLHIEVKRAERLNLTNAMNQAVHDAAGEAFPVVVHRSNRQPWLVTFRLSDFLEERRKREQGSETGESDQGLDGDFFND